jgi:hypothetical protein
MLPTDADRRRRGPGRKRQLTPLDAPPYADFSHIGAVAGVTLQIC